MDQLSMIAYGEVAIGVAQLALVGWWLRRWGKDIDQQREQREERQARRAAEGAETSQARAASMAALTEAREASKARRADAG